MLSFFGADADLLLLAQLYLKPIKIVLPLFLFNQLLAAFLRNDNHPGLATAVGSVISFIVMLSHFRSRKNTLAFVRPVNMLHQLKKISVTGFSTFFIDAAMGILTVLFNRQIMKYLETNALAVYGPVINVSTFVQCCAYSVGQASQPIISINFGAAEYFFDLLFSGTDEAESCFFCICFQRVYHQRNIDHAASRHHRCRFYMVRNADH